MPIRKVKNPLFFRSMGILIIMASVFFILRFLFNYQGLWVALGVTIFLIIIVFFLARDTIKDNIETLFSEIMLSSDKPFERGSRIVLEDGEIFDVREIGMRSTALYNVSEHSEIYVPNRVLASQKLMNISRPELFSVTRGESVRLTELEQNPVVSNIVKDIKKHKQDFKRKYPKLTIVGIMAKHRNAQFLQGISILSLAFILQTLLITNLSPVGSSILIVMIILLGIQKLIFDYRIRYGLYGNNEREAREIVHFILQEAENIDFTDNGKPKKIMSEMDLAQFEQEIHSLAPSPQR